MLMLDTLYLPELYTQLFTLYFRQSNS